MSVFFVVVAGDGYGVLRIGDGGASESLRVVNVDSGAVLATLFEAEGTLGGGASARMGEDGAFILELRMITGFDRAETRVVLWSASNTDSGKGGYSRQAPEFCSTKSTPYYFAVNKVSLGLLTSTSRRTPDWEKSGCVNVSTFVFLVDKRDQPSSSSSSFPPPKLSYVARADVRGIFSKTFCSCESLRKYLWQREAIPHRTT